MKKFALTFILLLALCYLLVSLPEVRMVKASTDVTGIISSDTTWTKADSPYTLTGNVIIDEGVTLTIEPGVNVSFNSYFMNVSGTLFAKGTKTEKITMTGLGVSYLGEWMGRLVFSNSSTNSTIEHAQITSSPNTIIGIYSAASTTLRNNTVGGTNGTAIYIKESSPHLIGNVISGNGASGILIEGPHSSPMISENTISNNTLTGIDVFYHGSPTIEENIITGNRYGITLFVAWVGDSATISDNILSNNTDGIHFFFFNKAPLPYVVTRNLITNSTNALVISVQYNFAGSATIVANTLTGNTNAIVVQYSSPSDDIKINQNNIYGNTQYNLIVNTGWSLDATYNWWGTTDSQEINRSISDTGRVNYIPFLTAPNSEAMPILEFPDTTPPLISIMSPENKTYNTRDIQWAFTANEPTSWMGYSLDGQANVTVAGNTTLSGLSDGTHSLTVYASDLFGNIGSSDTVYFTIDTTLPSITILSPENKTHDPAEIPLNFAVNEPVSWIGYSLDSQANVTITGNTTLSGLSDGSHSLIVYANDIAGNTGASKKITFRVTEPFPTTWIAATIVTIAVVVAALLVYFRKIRKTTGKAEIISEGVM